MKSTRCFLQAYQRAFTAQRKQGLWIHMAEKCFTSKCYCVFVEILTESSIFFVSNVFKISYTCWMVLAGPTLVIKNHKRSVLQFSSLPFNCSIAIYMLFTKHCLQRPLHKSAVPLFRTHCSKSPIHTTPFNIITHPSNVINMTLIRRSYHLVASWLCYRE